MAVYSISIAVQNFIECEVDWIVARDNFNSYVWDNHNSIIQYGITIDMKSLITINLARKPSSDIGYDRKRVSNPYSGSGLTGTGNWISPDSGQNLTELIFWKIYFIQKVFIKVRYAF